MKKRRVISVSVVLVVLFTTALSFGQSNTEYKMKIQTLSKEMAKCMIDCNIDKSLAMYTQDAISMPSYEPMHNGIAEIRKAAEDMVKSGMKYNSFELTTLEVIPNGNLITEIGTYKINATMPGMDKPMDDHGKYLTVWEKQKDGTLKVKIETWNSDVNPMAMMTTTGQKEMGK